MGLSNTAAESKIETNKCHLVSWRLLWRLSARDPEDPREKVISSTWEGHSQYCNGSRTEAGEMAISGQAWAYVFACLCYSYLMIGHRWSKRDKKKVRLIPKLLAFVTD